MKRAVSAAVLTGLAGVVFWAIRIPQTPPREVVEFPGIRESTGGPAPEPESQPRNKPVTFEQLKQGGWITFSDAEMRQWIRGNRGSEEAWLVAFTSRYSLDLDNPWLMGGLEANPHNLPLLVVAANIELLAFADSRKTASRKWIDRFLAADPDNGLAWFLSALAETYRGRVDLADEHWIRASESPGMRLYSTAFENAGYEFARAKGLSEAASTLMGSASVPTLLLPNLIDVFREIQARTDAWRAAGRVAEADALASASYRIGIQLFGEDLSDDHQLVHRLIGERLHEFFQDRVPLETRLLHAEADRRIDSFRERMKALRGRWPDGEEMSEAEYLTWSWMERNFGLVEAAERFARRPVE